MLHLFCVRLVHAFCAVNIAFAFFAHRPILACKPWSVEISIYVFAMITCFPCTDEFMFSTHRCYTLKHCGNFDVQIKGLTAIILHCNPFQENNQLNKSDVF